MLLLLAAIIHSIWNLLAKRSIHKHVFIWLGLCASSIFFLIPFCYFYKPFSPQGWRYILLSGLLEGIYYYFLGAAYRQGEISQVYPIARGSAPLWVTIFAICFLHEEISLQGFMGILLILAGINLMYFKPYLQKGFHELWNALKEKSAKYALITGISIACYQVVDKKGVSYVDPFIYIYLVFVVSAIALAPVMLKRKPAIKEELVKNKISILTVGIMNLTAYGLVLLAMTSSKVSYVSSVRELSVIITPVLGTILLKEFFTWDKIIGSVLIFFGIFSIALVR
ncbi:MAG: EamA family transporter [Dehalobacterium sp.]